MVYMHLALKKLGDFLIRHPLESVEIQMEAQLIGSANVGLCGVMNYRRDHLIISI